MTALPPILNLNLPVFDPYSDWNRPNYTTRGGRPFRTVSPAYDLTYSNSLGGEHATTIAGEGRNPAMKHLLTVAKKAGLKDAEARQIAENVQDTVKTRLSGYLKQ